MNIRDNVFAIAATDVQISNISRRKMLKGFALGGFVLAVGLPLRARAEGEEQKEPKNMVPIPCRMARSTTHWFSWPSPLTVQSRFFVIVPKWDRASGPVCPWLLPTRWKQTGGV